MRKDIAELHPVKFTFPRYHLCAVDILPAIERSIIHTDSEMIIFYIDTIKNINLIFSSLGIWPIF